jgi:hypothetical protein
MAGTYVINNDRAFSCPLWRHFDLAHTIRQTFSFMCSNFGFLILAAVWRLHGLRVDEAPLQRSQ